MSIRAVLARWPYTVFLGLDSLVSAIGFGAPGQTISSRLGEGRAHGSKAATLSCAILDGFVRLVFRQRDHCENAYRHWLERQDAAAF